MLHIKQFVFNAFGESTYVVSDDSSHDAIVVDPGMADAAEMQRITRFIDDNHLNLKAIVCTHLHIDHCMGAMKLAAHYHVPVMADKADTQLGEHLDRQAALFGLSGVYEPVVIDRALSHGDTISLGDSLLHVLSVPGHSPGGIALYSPDGKFVLAGDSLFSGSIGRTDLPGGDHATLIRSVRSRLLPLPDDTLVLSGHGPSTTIGDERRSNPYI